MVIDYIAILSMWVLISIYHVNSDFDCHVSSKLNVFLCISQSQNRPQEPVNQTLSTSRRQKPWDPTTNPFGRSKPMRDLKFTTIGCPDGRCFDELYEWLGTHAFGIRHECSDHSDILFNHSSVWFRSIGRWSHRHREFSKINLPALWDPWIQGLSWKTFWLCRKNPS